ncbi:MAG: rhodanese-like domain-containing protein [Bryobacteraceae bacterium]
MSLPEPKEWQSGHIERATHIPGGELPKCLDDLPTEGEIYVVCGSGYRSSVASSVLKRTGHGNVINVVGGMGAWMRQQLRTVSDQQPMEQAVGRGQS